MEDVAHQISGSLPMAAALVVVRPGDSGTDAVAVEQRGDDAAVEDVARASGEGSPGRKRAAASPLFQKLLRWRPSGLSAPHPQQ